MSATDARGGPGTTSGTGGVSGFSVGALTVGALAVVGVALWDVVPPGVWHDDGAYVLLGKALADGEGLRYAQVAGSPPGAKFPPLYPFLLAGLWKVAPSMVAQGALAALLNFVFVIVGGGVFVGYLRSLDFSWKGAVATVTFLWLIPDVWRLSLVPLSEPLFLLVLVLALWAGTRLERRPTWSALAVFLLAFAAAYHTRTMGVVLGAAVTGALVLRRHGWWAVRTALGSVLVVTPWLVWSSRAATAIPAPLRDTLGPYGGWLARQVDLAGGGALQGLFVAAVALTGRFGGVLFPGAGGFWGGALVAVVAVVVGLGAYRLSRESWTPVLTVGLMVGLLWLWPYQERRLTMPVAPLLGLILICGFRRELWAMVSSLRRLLPGGGERADVAAGVTPETPPLSVRATALGVAGLCWIAWLGSASVLHLKTDRHLEAYGQRSRMLARAVLALEERVPEDGVVGAPELWAGLALHTGRTVAPSARFHPVGEGPVWGTNREQFELWEAAGIDYVVLENAGRIHKDALDELDARCPGSVELLASWGGGMLVRLDWDEACKAEVLTTR